MKKLFAENPAFGSICFFAVWCICLGGLNLVNGFNDRARIAVTASPVASPINASPAPPVVTPPAVVSSSGMNADVKAILLSVLPVILGFVFATVTAAFITKQSDLQKQRVELYKLLFVERLGAAKKLSEITGGLFDKTSNIRPHNEKEQIEILQTAVNEAVLFLNSNSWLLRHAVAAKFGVYTDYLQKITNGEVSVTDGNGDNVRKQGKQLVADVMTEVRSMMLDEDLSHLVTNKSPY